MAATLVRDGGRALVSAHRLALAGVLGPPLFVAVFLVVGLIKPGYNPITRDVSESAIGELGWIQIANFLMLGAALLLFAIGLWQGFGDRSSGRIGSVLVAIAGIGLLGAGVFVTDEGALAQPTTFHGIVHDLASAVTFLSLLISAFVFARRFWPDRLFAIYSILSGLAIPAGFAIADRANAGLVQRVMVVLFWTWLTILALRLRRSTA